ncbi:hypothetical protein U3516DRAFT_768547 [Neocallimastix sp. 'constans']
MKPISLVVNSWSSVQDVTTEDFGLPHIVIWVYDKLSYHKETPYRSTLRDPRGKAEPTIGAGHSKTSPLELNLISQEISKIKFKII